jgi:hypothetical protein
MSHWVDEGKQLLQAGNRIEGERALRIAIKEDERSVEAWLWLARAVQSDAERITCLLKVMELDPRNATARRTLAALEEKSRTSGRNHIDPFKTDGADDNGPTIGDPFLDGSEAANLKVEKPLSPPGKENPFAQHSEVVEGQGPLPLHKVNLRSMARGVIVALIVLGIAVIITVLVIISK